MSELKTRDQKYAAVVYEQVHQMLEREKSEREDYGRLANHLPVLVKKAGLAQALSFAEAKGGKGDKQLLMDLQTAINKISGQQLNLPDRSRQAELPDYLWLTQQVMTALHWYKRFAQSVLEVKNDG
jgi:CRISPR-associated protein Cmr5